jgi:hypothetical protein
MEYERHRPSSARQLADEIQELLSAWIAFEPSGEPDDYIRFSRIIRGLVVDLQQINQLVFDPSDERPLGPPREPAGLAAQRIRESLDPQAGLIDPLPRQDYERLMDMAQSLELSPTRAVRRSIATQNYLDARLGEGWQLLITKRGDRRKVVLPVAPRAAR